MPETLLDIPEGQPPAVAPTVVLGESRVRYGACSWADRSLVRDGEFYPKKTMTASARLAYYTSQLPLAEIATTYRFPPTPELAAQWAERTQNGFCFDVRAWSLLTDSPTLPDSLWEDLQREVRPEARHRRRLYAVHLPDEVVDECWARFAHALRPLQSQGRLGVVVLQYPSWWSPSPDHRLALAAARERLSDFRVAVELRSRKWLEGGECEATLELLEDHDLSFVCTDGPAAGPRALPEVVAATAEVAVVRFHGRRQDPDDPWTWPYRYRDAELAEWVPRVTELAASAREVHLLFDNGWRADAVDNARTLARLLGGVRPDRAGSVTGPGVGGAAHDRPVVAHHPPRPAHGVADEHVDGGDRGPSLGAEQVLVHRHPGDVADDFDAFLGEDELELGRALEEREE
jgi:uncharacterized protein YecE (DUF72 family)